MQVGNDYSLLGAGYAAAIDAHDTVLRLASNALPGYERYVGSKTDATYMTFDCQARETPLSRNPVFLNTENTET